MRRRAHVISWIALDIKSKVDSPRERNRCYVSIIHYLRRQSNNVSRIMNKRKQKDENVSSEPLRGFARLRGVRLIPWLLLFVILFFAFVRFRLRDMPLERDEGEYAYSGQLMLQGIPPYQLAYNMKVPGTYAAYALIMAIFGQSSTGIHIGLILANAATTLFVVALGKKLFGVFSGAFAGITYALLSVSPAVLGLAGHA